MKSAILLILGLTVALAVCPGMLGSGPNPPNPASSGDYITGKVTFGQSNPATSVWVLVYDGANLKGRSLTGDDGRYYIGGLNAKTYRLVVKRQPSGSDLASNSVSLPRDSVHNINLP